MSRYIVNTDDVLDAPFAEAEDELSLCLHRIVTNCPPMKPWANDGFKNTPRGLWTGPTSIAYLFLWLAYFNPDEDYEGASAMAWCELYLDCGQNVIPLEYNESGIKNEYLAWSALNACVTRSHEAVMRLLQGIILAQRFTRADYNEYLSGRAGALFLLRLTRFFVPSATEQLTAAMPPLINHILTHRPWSFNGREYLGAAHGNIGIITQIVLSNPSYASALEPDLLAILDLQRDDGHWYVRPIDDTAEVVEWCHGTPGIIVSLRALRQHFPALQGRIDVAIAKGLDEVRQKGVLRKQPNLCHGASGNAMALEGSDRSQMMQWTTLARIQAGLETGEYLRGEDPWGLQWGEAGRAWAWMIECREADLHAFAAYTDVRA